MAQRDTFPMGEGEWIEQPLCGEPSTRPTPGNPGARPSPIDQVSGQFQCQAKPHDPRLQTGSYSTRSAPVDLASRIAPMDPGCRTEVPNSRSNSGSRPAPAGLDIVLAPTDPAPRTAPVNSTSGLTLEPGWLSQTQGSGLVPRTLSSGPTPQSVCQACLCGPRH